MAKKASNANGELTLEELEAIEAEKAKNKKKKDENPDAPSGPVIPPTIPDNPGNLPEDVPTDNTETIIVTGPVEDPEVIIIDNTPPETPLQPSESDSEPQTIKDGSDG